MDDQAPPRGYDNRRRVHSSTNFYVAELMVSSTSATWHFNDAAERIVYELPNGHLVVSFKGRFVPIRSKAEMAKLVTEHLALGLPAIIGGKHLFPREDKDLTFRAFPFIDITSVSERERFRAFLANRV